MTTKLEDLFGPDEPDAEFGSPKEMFPIIMTLGRPR